MRRVLLVFLLVLMPIQFAWSSVASYCGHESGVAAKHVGHHAHEHDGAKTPDMQKKVGSIAVPDDDCSTCHTSAPSPPPADFEVESRAPHFATPLLEPTPDSSAIADTPDRPNWSLAA